MIKYIGDKYIFLYMVPVLIFPDESTVKIDSKKIMFRDKNYEVFIGEKNVGKCAMVSGMRSNGAPYIIEPASHGIKIRINESKNNVKHYGANGKLLDEATNKPLTISYCHSVEIGNIEFRVGKH